eukprot:9487303-Pyramimonas_sp.AAC.1
MAHSVDLPAGPRNVRWAGGRMRAPPRGPQAEPPVMGLRSAVLGAGNAFERRLWGLRWGPPVGPRNAALGGEGACKHRRWDL